MSYAKFKKYIYNILNEQPIVLLNLILEYSFDYNDFEYLRTDFMDEHFKYVGYDDEFIYFVNMNADTYVIFYDMVNKIQHKIEFYSIMIEYKNIVKITFENNIYDVYTFDTVERKKTLYRFNKLKKLIDYKRIKRIPLDYYGLSKGYDIHIFQNSIDNIFQYDLVYDDIIRKNIIISMKPYNNIILIVFHDYVCVWLGEDSLLFCYKKTVT